MDLAQGALTRMTLPKRSVEDPNTLPQAPRKRGRPKGSGSGPGSKGAKGTPRLLTAMRRVVYTPEKAGDDTFMLNLRAWYETNPREFMKTLADFERVAFRGKMGDAKEQAERQSLEEKVREEEIFKLLGEVQKRAEEKA